MDALASDDQLERHIDALLECIGGVEKSRDYSKLHQETVIDKNGRPRKVWKRNKDAPQSGHKGKTRIEKQRETALSALESNAVRMGHVRYDKTIYERLFRDKKIETKIGEVKLGENQFERLAGKDGGARTNLLYAMYQTLKYPCVIFTDTDAQGRDASLFVKTFDNGGKKKTTIAVVAIIDGVLVSVSFGIRKENAIRKKIKNAKHFLYIAKPKEKESGRTNGTAHAAGVAHPDAIKGNRNSSSATLPQTGGAVNKKSSKSKKWLWVENGKIWTRKSVLEAWRRETAGGL